MGWALGRRTLTMALLRPSTEDSERNVKHSLGVPCSRSQGFPYNGPTIMKRASLHTLGCRLNQAETAVLAARLRRDGYRVVEFGEPTDLLVVNTCSVTEEAERTCRYAIRKTLRHSPDAFVAVTGCYAQTGVHELRTIPGIDLIVGNQFKWDLPSFLPSPYALKKQPEPDVLHTRTIEPRGLHATGVWGTRLHQSPDQSPGWLQCDVQLLSHSLRTRA